VDKFGKCQICGIEEPLEKHHLVPQNKCKGSKKNLKNDPSNHIYICGTCHRTIHAYFDERELRYELNSLEKLLSNDRFSKYIAWRRKHPDFRTDSSKMSKEKRKRR